MKHHVKSTDSIRLTTPLEFKFAGAASEVEGYASIFGFVDVHGETVEPGAFEKTLERHKSEGTLPAMLWSHEPSEPIGKWISMSEDDQGLKVRGQLNLNSARGQQAQSHIKAGDVGGLSIGFLPVRAKKNPDGSRALIEVDLLEVSVVAMPANRRARIVNLKQATNLPEFEVQLRSIGYSRAEARRLAQRAWPKPGETPEIDLSEIVRHLQRQAAERKSWK